ncbi:MAG: hypothetical protein AAF598_20350 [Bacteroidota bacterium]
MLGALSAFYLVGFYLMIGRYFHSIFIRRRTFYAVSNQRVIWVSWMVDDPVSILIDRLPAIRMEIDNHQGKGTLLFDQEGHQFLGRIRSSMPFALQRDQLAFDAIPKVERVYELISALQKGAMAHQK